MDTTKKIKMYELHNREQLTDLRRLHTVVPLTPNLYPCFLYSENSKGAEWTTASEYEIKRDEFGSYKNHVIVPYSEWSNVYNTPSVKEQIEFAKTLIGKKIISTSNIDGIVTGVSAKTVEDYEKEFVGTRKPYTKEQQASNDKHGVIVSLVGTWNSFSGPSKMRLPIYQGYTLEDLPEVNGYKCEDKGSYYQWGCAKIGKDTLLSARVFLSRSQEYNCNRKPEYVMIGEGKFTLEILRKLKLD